MFLLLEWFWTKVSVPFSHSALKQPFQNWWGTFCISRGAPVPFQFFPTLDVVSPSELLLPIQASFAFDVAVWSPTAPFLYAGSLFTWSPTSPGNGPLWAWSPVLALCEGCLPWYPHYSPPFLNTESPLPLSFSLSSGGMWWILSS